MTFGGIEISALAFEFGGGGELSQLETTPRELTLDDALDLAAQARPHGLPERSTGGR